MMNDARPADRVCSSCRQRLCWCCQSCQTPGCSAPSTASARGGPCQCFREDADLERYPRSFKEATAILRLVLGDAEIELVDGEGYCYFSGGIASRFEEQGVYGCSGGLKALTLAGWIREARLKIERVNQ